MEGYLRQSDLIGEPEVTQERADRNRAAGSGPTIPRPAKHGIVPVSSSTWWRMVRSGEAPQPVKLSAGVTAWDVKVIRAWLESRGIAMPPSISPVRPHLPTSAGDVLLSALKEIADGGADPVRVAQRALVQHQQGRIDVAAAEQRLSA